MSKNLVISREGDGFAVTAQDGSRISAVGYDDLNRCDDCNHGGRSNSVAFWGLHLTPTTSTNDPFIPSYHLPVHPPETPHHRRFPFCSSCHCYCFLALLQFLLHQLMQSLLAPERHLKNNRGQKRFNLYHP